MYTKHCFIVILFVIVNLARSSSDMTKSWISSSQSLNLQPDLPSFTPFENNEYELNHRQQKNDKLNDLEQTATEKPKEKIKVKEESLAEKLTPIADYVMELYDTYKKSLEKPAEKDEIENVENSITREEEPEEESEDDEQAKVEEEEEVDNTPSPPEEKVEKSKSRRKRFIKYNVGPGVNVSLDIAREMVQVHLDEECLKDVFTGRGRKKDLITKTLALFILPFLIQSSFVPFLLTSVKILLLKSVVVGKIAILLLMIAAFKNSKARLQEMPYYLAESPQHRRSESDAYGYQADGRPMTFIT